MEEPDNAKRQNLSNFKTGEVIQSEKGELKTKGKSAAHEVVNGTNHEDTKKQKIKWKKIITKILETVSLLALLYRIYFFCPFVFVL